ncbi:MAG: DUF262 domain-containing protein [Thermoguttaceae bacterium]|jgi:uncharacterized protein with ParB-like and HNH nuclease domain
MTGKEKKLAKFMEGSSKRFIVPVYQRSYDWKKENCKQLYDDLIKVIKNQRRSHFFGSIVSTRDEDGHTEEYLIIDGQQRLTTVSLILLALHNLIEQGKIVPTDKQLSTKIYENYLIDKWVDEGLPRETRIKLKSVKNDREAFSRLFDDEQEYIRESNLTLNYYYFYDRILKNEITVDQIYDAVKSLEIIDISLNSEDNPQLIFESLNSTGLDLTEGDKIRNYVLMGMPSKRQEAIYEKYWDKIEKNSNGQVDLFVRDYLSIKQQVIPPLRKIYFSFKEFMEGNETDIEELLTEILDYSRRYRILLFGGDNNRQLRACINRLNGLGTKVTRPFFLEVLRLHDESVLTIDNVVEIFLIIENYLFRRIVCDVPTNALDNLFLLLHKEIVGYDGTTHEYVEKLKYALRSKRERTRFPGDTEFRDELGIKQVYLMHPKNRVYILERFENFGTKEDKDIYHHIEDGTYSIEHIMPRNLSPAWIESLGEEYERIHETWLHRLANLTLTAYNSKYSNSGFVEKRDMKHGFADSGIKMNQWIARQNQWGESELEKRSELLQQRALEIWSLPTTDFKPTTKQLEYYTLGDDVDLSGRKIARFAYGAMQRAVSSWIAMFEEVIRLLHSENKQVLNQLASEPAGVSDLSGYFSYDKKLLRQSLEIENGLYVEKNTSTQVKMKILRGLFDRHGRDLGCLRIFLHDEDE